MNDERRKELKKAAALIEEAKDIIESAASDERDYFDNMPESLQQSDRGTRAEEVADDLDEVASDLEGLIDRINDAQE